MFTFGAVKRPHFNNFPGLLDLNDGVLCVLTKGKSIDKINQCVTSNKPSLKFLFVLIAKTCICSEFYCLK